jgi:hypothetical protein
MSKLKEITREEKKLKIGGNLRANPPLQSMYPIIDNISLPYDFVKHYIFPFLQKRSSKKCCERSHYVRSSEQCCQGSQIRGVLI